jgi:hypothetical protein
MIEEHGGVASQFLEIEPYKNRDLTNEWIPGGFLK